MPFNVLAKIVEYLLHLSFLILLGSRLLNSLAKIVEYLPIEAWKYLGEVEEIWLTRLFNKTLMTKSMLDEWRISFVIPIYKNERYTKLYQLSWN